MPDLYLYDLIHPLFLSSMSELGTENLVLSLLKKHPEKLDEDIMTMSNISRGTFYKYKKTLQHENLI